MAGKNRKSREGRPKKKGRGMSSLFACLGGCGGRVPREDAEEITQLDFRHFSLTEVPPDVFACECSLETLYLDSNQLAELPRELFHCHGLKTLSLSDNELKTLPQATAELTSLQTLDVSKNNLSGIPDSIKSCRELRSVDASVNPLCRLPEGFTQLIALKELFLNDTFLEYLPANFGRLACLEVLELRENQLNTLPKSLARLTKLRRLDIGSNEFSQLPEVVGSLSSLTELWFDGNRVRSVAPFVGQLSQLTYLDGSNNRIDALPDELANCKILTDLHLSINHLKNVPDSLCECSGLQVLRLDDNALAELPADIGALSKLTELVLTKNDLESLPPSIGLLRHLHTLHADDNVLTAVPSEIGSCSSLAVLTLAANRLPALPPEIGHLGSLRVLNVWDNCIRNLPVSFSKLKLMALWLSDNQAKPAVQLQTETDSRTGQKVLTCYMLPQQPGQRRDEKEKDEPFPAANWEEKHKARSIIKFSFDEAEPKTGAKLSRAPTPYPKELRALAKHARNLTGNNRSSVGEEEGGSKRESRGEEGEQAEVRGRREEGPPGEERSRKSQQEEQTPEAGGGRAASVQLLTAGSVKAEYQAAGATFSKNEFGSQPVVKTANKTSPESVMASAPSPPTEAPSLSAKEQEGGLVAPPMEERPPQLREARAVLQSQLQKPQQEPESPQAANPEQVFSARRSQGSPNKALSGAVAGQDTNSTATPSSPTKAAGVAAMDTLSDDETPADLLAEALAVADVVANSNKVAPAEDPADRSSTDSGYGRPSQITNSLNDVSDRSSDLVSPVSSLPPETPTSPSSNSVKHNAFSYSNSSTPHQSPLARPTQAYSSSASPASTPQKMLYQHPAPVTTEFPGRSLPSPTPNSFSPAPDSHRMAYGGSSLQQPRPGSLALASLAESGVLSDHAGYLNRPGSLAAPCNTLGIPPAPPTRAISAATGLNHPPYAAATPPGRPGSVSAPRSGASSGLPTVLAESTYGVGNANTGGLYTIQQNSPTSPSYSPSSNVTTNLPIVSSNGNIPAYNDSISLQGDRNSTSINSSQNVSGPKYYTPSSRIPMNKQLSTSSMDSNESSRIPPYTSQLSNKSMSSESGSKIPQYGAAADNNSRIPSLSTSGRSYSNLSNKSVNQEQVKNLNNVKSPNGTFEGYNNKDSGIRAPQNGSFNATPSKESRIHYSGSSPNYNSNIKSPTQISTGGNYRSPSVTNGSGLPTPSKPSSLPSPAYSSGIPGAKSTGIPTPGYTRSNSTLSNSDKESRIPSMNTSGSFGKSSVAPNNNNQAKLNTSTSRIPMSPYSPNTSFESARDYRSGAPSQSRLPNPQYGAPGYRSPGGDGITSPSYYSPVNQAINTPGLPPLPASSTEGRRPSIPQLQQPKAGGSKIPQFGVPSGAGGVSPSFSAPGSGPGPQQPSTGRPLSAQQQQQPQSAPWMFGNHQNARVFPVVIEKDPGPGFTLTETSHPEKCLFVSSVVPHGPASSALKPGDKILQIDGEAIGEVDSATLAALADHNDDTVALLVSRLHS